MVCRNVDEGYELGRLEYPNWDSLPTEKKQQFVLIKVAVLLNLVLRFGVMHALHWKPTTVSPVRGFCLLSVCKMSKRGEDIY